MKSNSFRKIINSRINREDLIKNPELSDALEKDKIIRFDFLSKVKPNLINTKGFKNIKKKNMVEDMNLFKKIYYKDYMINKHSLDKIYKLSSENNIFLNHFSGFNRYYNNENQKKILNAIQLEYKKKMGFSPTIKENTNLFSNSILLQNDRDLKQYISLDLDTIKSDVNSLSFLKNIQNNIKMNGSKSQKNNILAKINSREIVEFPKIENENSVRQNEKKNNSSHPKDKYESINDLRRDISKAKDSFNSMNNLNYFLNTNNQEYLNYIGNMISRKSSGEATTRMNSGVKKLNIKLKLNEDINDFNTINTYKGNNTEDKTNNSKISKNANSNILPVIKNSMETINVSSNNELKEAKSYNLKKTIDYINTDSKNESKIGIDFHSNININNLSAINKKKSKNKNKTSLRKHINGLEKLYEKISKTENFIGHNKEIRNYLRRNNYNVMNKINGKDLYNSVDQSRKKITDISGVQKNYELMVNNKLKTIEQNNEMIQNNFRIKKNIENIEERMIGLLCDINKNEDN